MPRFLHTVGMSFVCDNGASVDIGGPIIRKAMTAAGAINVAQMQVLSYGVSDAPTIQPAAGQVWQRPTGQLLIISEVFTNAVDGTGDVVFRFQKADLTWTANILTIDQFIAGATYVPPSP